MMVEGVVEVTGSVVIDNSTNVDTSSSVAVGDGRTICDQIMREVSWAVRQATVRALCDTRYDSGAEATERRKALKGVGQVERSSPFRLDRPY